MGTIGIKTLIVISLCQTFFCLFVAGSMYDNVFAESGEMIVALAWSFVNALALLFFTMGI